MLRLHHFGFIAQSHGTSVLWLKRCKLKRDWNTEPCFYSTYCVGSHTLRKAPTSPLVSKCSDDNFDYRTEKNGLSAHEREREREDHCKLQECPDVALWKALWMKSHEPQELLIEWLLVFMWSFAEGNSWHLSHANSQQDYEGKNGYPPRRNSPQANGDEGQGILALLPIGHSHLQSNARSAFSLKQHSRRNAMCSRVSVRPEVHFLVFTLPMK